MNKIELFPDRTHCIETIARKEYQNLVKACLHDEEGDSESWQKVNLLRIFLESADFKNLRRESEVYLTKDQKVKFELCYERGAAICRLYVNECETLSYIMPEDGS